MEAASAALKVPKNHAQNRYMNRTVRLMVIDGFAQATGDSQKYCSYSTDEFFKVWRHDLTC